ncbi:hypothetical protein [Motilibacter deserti]|uniref:Uncharacterized protein n=1 Tax=Motilibacter deserti TaxID=2714956 RepID=A0ABX0GP31_9ACTN|nr:hypothetical protein [Motilibacter deserti]NHC12589.1 hypothetical protein [Motilibacter deserti]
MGFLDKRRRPTEDGVASSSLEPGERVLTAEADENGGTVAVTDRALLLPGAERLPWHLVLAAGWDADEAQLRVTGVDGARWTVRLPDPGRVPEAVRERVQSSIVARRRVTLVGERGVLVAVRRMPDSEDLVWQVRPEAGIDLRDPAVRERVDDAVAELRAALGL